ncbi:hypothetical protein B7C42_08375 [Nocardia cerradoensis]|uniref:Uncharacterized protein n=1 Tax=Nocardia cerradoensis TaxID=85688 RepID=A0A231GSF2_9NOCA|nr:hypothetical protein B7C42_08375 [Nocardia cerradoensis]
MVAPVAPAPGVPAVGNTMLVPVALVAPVPELAVNPLERVSRPFTPG